MLLEKREQFSQNKTEILQKRDRKITEEMKLANLTFIQLV